MTKIAITGDSWSRLWDRDDPDIIQPDSITTANTQNKMPPAGFPLLKVILDYAGYDTVDFCQPGLGNFVSLSQCTQSDFKPDYIVHFLTDPVRDYKLCRTDKIYNDSSIKDQQQQELLESFQCVEDYESYVVSTLIEFYDALQQAAQQYNSTVFLVGGCFSVNKQHLDPIEHSRIKVLTPNVVNWVISLMRSPASLETYQSEYFGFPNWVHLLNEKCSKQFVDYVYDHVKQHTNIRQNWTRPKTTGIDVAQWPDYNHMNATSMQHLAYLLLNRIEKNNY